ncbi:MAG TPA: porin [Polyangiaceae bacterium]
MRSLSIPAVFLGISVFLAPTARAQTEPKKGEKKEDKAGKGDVKTPKPTPPVTPPAPKEKEKEKESSDAAAMTPTNASAPSTEAAASGSWTTSPTSMSGSELLPAGGAQPTSTGGDPALEARIASLEARLKADEEKKAQDEQMPWWVKHVNLTGYIQPQLLWQVFNAAASPNNQPGGGFPPNITPNDTTATTAGASTNKAFFRFRRARLKTEVTPNEYTRLSFEIDPTGAPTGTTGSTIMRQVEATGIAKWCKDWSWFTEFSAGIFKLPFDNEIVQSDADRPFIERSWGEQNMFPGEFDEGVHETTWGFKKKLRIDMGVVNGTMLNEANFSAVPDLNKTKDFVGRVNFDPGPFDIGVGVYAGEGAEVDAAALKFKQFPRWAANVHGGFHAPIVKALGDTKLLGEFVIAKNMDRGLNYARGIGQPIIPADVVNGYLQDHDERSVWIRLEQDVTRWVTLGIRYDFYSPDTAQKNDARDTYAFVGALHINRWLQWMVEFDHAIDNVHQPGAQAPSKQIETFSTVLQARF